ncbi:MAG: histidine kinase [Rubrivivax sp.]|nr:histidine kinase [Rubrivivax sp.]
MRFTAWDRLPRAARRGLSTLVFSAGVGGVVSLLLAAPLGESVVYAVCVSLAIWACIDGGRLLAARWVRRHEAAQAGPPTGWPGWGWMVPILLLGTLVGYLLGHTLAGVLLGRGLAHTASMNPRTLVTILLLSLLPGTAVTGLFYTRARLAGMRATAERAERLASEQRLALLASQLEPHMLFNTLANLRVLIGADPPRAQAMLDRLILFLRATLDASRQGTHTLGAEFARLHDYLELMKVRMGARLDTRLDLPDALAAHPVPALLLQPLVENAIKHGLEPQPRGGQLRVSASAQGPQLVLRVRDTGRGLPAAPGGGGFGLNQVRERLHALFGDAASLEAVDAADAEGGALITIRLPL